MKEKMKKSDELQACDSVRAARTEAFLTSFLIREKLAAVPIREENCETSSEITLRPMNPFNPFPGVGQIRLLSQIDGISYVLLARKWGEDAFLVIPFSRYADPATDMELKTCEDLGACLQVLQVWNARTLQRETLRRSWLIGRMNEGDCKDALSLWVYSVGGAAPRASVLQRTGVPIRRQDDPRIRYQDAVLREFAELDSEDLRVAERSQKRLPVLAPIWESFRLAAGEETASTVRRRRCRVKGLAGEVKIVYSSARKRLSLEVYDAKGETSSELDGWHFLYHDGTDFGTIDKGRVVAEGVFECNGACCLLDTKGEICVLMPVKEK